MRRFKFTLESVLMLREKTLEDERTKLAKIIGFYNKECEVLDELQNNLNDLKENSIFFAGTINPQLVDNFNTYVIKLSNDIEIQKQNLKKVELDIEKQKAEVKKAYIQVKTLEKLKEKQKEKYFAELQLEEIKFIDDITTSKRRA